VRQWFKFVEARALRIEPKITRTEPTFKPSGYAMKPLSRPTGLSEGDSDYSTRWRLIKSGFSRSLPGPTTRRVWQDRFWE